jgi:hypothetical protein
MNENVIVARARLGTTQSTFRPLLDADLVKAIKIVLDEKHPGAAAFRAAVLRATRTTSDEHYVGAAINEYVREGDREIAIDADCAVSPSREGAFVMAWVWVPKALKVAAPASTTG